jgi:hypothetical protein
MIGSACDTAGLARGNGSLGVKPRSTALDLDEGEASAAHGHKVKLAVWRAAPPSQDAIALQHHGRGSDRLGPPPAPVTVDPLSGGRWLAHRKVPVGSNTASWHYVPGA